jgi:hypothetical protein
MTVVATNGVTTMTTKKKMTVAEALGILDEHDESGDVAEKIEKQFATFGGVKLDDDELTTRRQPDDIDGAREGKKPPAEIAELDHAAIWNRFNNPKKPKE